jgi:hypothetical protein
VAWLLQFVVRHSIRTFVPYRLGLGVTLAAILAFGVTTAT